jgi:hypothetical protein
VPLNPGDDVEYAVNPKAENQKWLREGYYAKQIKGKLKSWIDANLRNKPASLVHGRAVHPLFNADVGTSRASRSATCRNIQLYVGFDFGLTPAAIFGQIRSAAACSCWPSSTWRTPAPSPSRPMWRPRLIRRFPNLNFDTSVVRRPGRQHPRPVGREDALRHLLVRRRASASSQRRARTASRARWAARRWSTTS